MIVKLLTEHHLECLSLKGGFRDSSESTHVKMPHCWKSYTVAHIVCTGFIFHCFSFQGRHSKEAQCRRATPCVCTALVSISSQLLLYTLFSIHLCIRLFAPPPPVLPTEALSNVFKYNLSYDRNSTSLGTSSVHINIVGNGLDKNIRIYDIRGLFKYECKWLHNFLHIYATTKCYTFLERTICHL